MNNHKVSKKSISIVFLNYKIVSKSVHTPPSPLTA